MMIETFGRHMIEEFLRAFELKFLVDQDGDFVVNFFGDDVPDYQMQLCAEGRDHSILAIRVGAAAVLPEVCRDRAEAFAAGWNGRTRWPKAYLADDPQARGFRVVGDQELPLRAGVHRELLHDFILTMLAAGRQLLADFVASVTVSDDDELDRWLRDTA